MFWSRHKKTCFVLKFTVLISDIPMPSQSPAVNEMKSSGPAVKDGKFSSLVLETLSRYGSHLILLVRDSNTFLKASTGEEVPKRGRLLSGRSYDRVKAFSPTKKLVGAIIFAHHIDHSYISLS